MPLAHVLVGIDRAFESDAQASSLAFCRRRVEELVEHLPAEAKAAGPESVPLRAVEEALQRLEERLLELSQEAKGVFSLVLPHLRELRDLVAVSARPNWDYLRGKLREIDLAVTEAAPQALDPEGAKAIEAEARRAVERHQGRVDAGSPGERGVALDPGPGPREAPPAPRQSALAGAATRRPVTSAGPPSAIAARGAQSTRPG